jgi:rubrerythrin
VLDLRERARAEMPPLGDVPPPYRAFTIATWRMRMVNEYASSEVFELLGEQLGRAFDETLAEACTAFADEERRHGVLCGAVVEACGGEARAPIPARASFPRHPDAPPRAAALRNLISVACLSETVAVSLIGAERLEMPDGPLRELLTRIYADEVGHARFGWRLLEAVAGDLDSSERAAIERYLPVAFEHLENHELLHLPNRGAPEGGAAFGLCSGRDARLLLAETVSDVIRPGLARWFS